jgi:hypothetical protein
MTTDRYTKAILTVIAGCLLWMCVMHTGVPVRAQQNTMDLSKFNAAVQPVVVVGTGSIDQQTGAIAVNLVQDGGRRRTDPTLAVALPYTRARPLPVSVPYDAANPLPTALPYSEQQPLAVQITAVKKAGTWEPIRAEVEDAPVRKKPGIER